jgi:MFS family permease
MFLAALDQTVMSTASLTISQYFHHVADQSWLITIYIATSLLSTPVYGRLSDAFGRRRLFTIGIAIFGLGSLLAALSNNFDLMVSARAIQGIGAGGLFSLAFAVIADVIPIRDRGRYILLFVLIFGSASILGPILGGEIASMHSIFRITGWRWIFIFNIPFVLIALFLALKYLPNKSHRLIGKFDWIGTLLFALAIIGALGIIQSSRSHVSIIFRAAFVIIFYLLLIGFILRQKQKGIEALFPPEFFRDKAFSLTVLISAVASGAMLVAMTIGSLSIQIVEYKSPSVAGFVLLFMGLGNFIGSGYVNRVISKNGPQRNMAIVGLSLFTLGFIPLLLSSTLISVAAGLLIIGSGAGFINQFTSIVAPNTLGIEHRGSASAINTLFRQLGGLTGVSIAMATIFYLWKVPEGFKVSNLNLTDRMSFTHASKFVYLATGLATLVMAYLARMLPHFPLIQQSQELNNDQDA